MPANWNESRRLLDRSRRSLAGGVSSPFRAKAAVPLYFRDGRGPILTDVDGNEYVDYVLGWGPNILGYRHPAVVEAVRRAAEGPHTYGAQHEVEYEVAERLQQMVPCAERVAFTSSGSEAVQLAMRLARAFTGRPKILKFEGHYHGWMDSALLSYHPTAEEMGDGAPRVTLGSPGQVANAADNVIAARWNRTDLLEELFNERADEIAAVFMEPVLCNSGCLLPRENYLVEVHDLCRRHGALLVFDEVITGFRMAPGGAQGFYGVTPDLATLGKAVAGGLPLSVVAGRAEILEMMFTGGVAFGGTFNGNPVSLAAANATLTELSRDNGALLGEANRLGETLMAEIRSAAGNIPLRVLGFGTAFCLHFTNRAGIHEYRDTLADDRARLTRFLTLALEHGIHSVPDGRFYVSATHTEREVERTLSALSDVFQILAG